MPRFAYVGCRTTRERNAVGEGISVFEVMGDAPWVRVQLVAGLVNPSWLTLSVDKNTLYVAHGDQETISAYRIEGATGQLVHMATVSSGGRNPVHIAAHSSGRYLVVTNHVRAEGAEPCIVTIELDDDGRPGDIIDTLVFDGPVGPHRKEQPFPKPHQAEFDPTGRWLIVPDKGTNRIETVHVSEGGRFEGIRSGVILRETAGPRHVTFHPTQPWLYVINELDSTVYACTYDPQTGEVMPGQVQLAQRPGCVGDSRGAEIAASGDGRHVYVTNRGDDTIAGFAVDTGTGFLEPMEWAATGRTPEVLHHGTGAGRSGRRERRRQHARAISARWADRAAGRGSDRREGRQPDQHRLSDDRLNVGAWRRFSRTARLAAGQRYLRAGAWPAVDRATQRAPRQERRSSACA